MSVFGILIVALLQQPAASIEGVVVRAGTSQPITRAMVELRGGPGSESLAMPTDAEGKFEFRKITPGPYRLTVSRSGYLDSAYGQRGPTGAGVVLVMESGQSRKNIRLAMIASGAVSGRVHDSNGEPAANVPVLALQYSSMDGQKTLTTIRTDTTDDRGEYRLFGLPPGSYYISGTPLNETKAPFYYPGTVDARSAAPVEVRPGAEIGSIDFTIAFVRKQKVRGTVVDSSTGRGVPSATVALVPRNPSVAASLNGRLSLDGAFEFPGVIPGSYFLVATCWRDNIGVITMLGASLPVEVGGTDMEGLTIVLSPPIDVLGEVIIEDNNRFDSHPTITLKSDIRSLPGRTVATEAQFSSGGRFVIHDVLDGDYRVQVSDLPQGVYVKSIRFGPAAEVLNGPIHIDRQAIGRLAIVLSANAAALDGTVIDENRVPIANAAVALLPDAASRQRTDLYRIAWTDDLGRFHLRAIPPGDYSLFATDGTEEVVWWDPEFTGHYQAAGRALRIPEAGNENIELMVH